jgi:hypothetical protein
MTIEFQCPGCGNALRAPDTTVGRMAACPKCGGHVTVPPAGVQAVPVAEPPPIPSAAPEAEDPLGALNAGFGNEAANPFGANPYGARPITKPGGYSGYGRAGTPPEWLGVRGGLSVCFVGNVLVMVGLVTVLLVALIGVNDGFRSGGAALFLLAKLLCSIFAAGTAGWVIGNYRCGSAPDQSGARGFALGSAILSTPFAALVVVFVISMVFEIRQLIMVIAQAFEGIPEPVSWVLNKVPFAASVLFTLFLRRVGAYLGDFALASRVTNYLIVSCVLMGLSMLLDLAVHLGIVNFSFFGGNPMVVVNVLILLMIVMILTFGIWHCVLLRATRDAIDQGGAGRYMVRGQGPAAGGPGPVGGDHGM